MDLINNLRTICNKKIEETNDDKYRLISKILSDDDCFYIVDMDVMLDILTSLDIENPLEYYTKVMSLENVEQGKAKIID